MINKLRLRSDEAIAIGYRRRTFTRRHGIIIMVCLFVTTVFERMAGWFKSTGNRPLVGIFCIRFKIFPFSCVQWWSFNQLHTVIEGVIHILHIIQKCVIVLTQAIAHKESIAQVCLNAVIVKSYTAHIRFIFTDALEAIEVRIVLRIVLNEIIERWTYVACIYWRQWKVGTFWVSHNCNDFRWPLTTLTKIYDYSNFNK